MIDLRRSCPSGQALPVAYEPAGASPLSAHDALELLRARRSALAAELHRHGALLLRGFPVEDAAAFREVVRLFAPRLQGYEGGDSPRTAVADRVYTSTSYPASEPIPLHNELSYAREYPALIAFYCEVAPESGGATPLADGRRALRALPAALAGRLRERRLRYLQNLHGGTGLGKSWRDTFETADRAQVEAILARRGAAYRWRPDGSLHVEETVDPIALHPVTGEPALFCQAHLWHVSSLDPRTRAALLRLVREEDLYHACTYGDGAPIGEDDLAALRGAYEAAAVEVPWQRRDVLLVDNVLVAHGRRPFRGPRRILVAMGGAEP